MVDALIEEFTYRGELPLEVIAVRILGAVLLCGLIGLERELQKNTAGLRTNMLIGLAAATFALIGEHLVVTYDTGDTLRLDPFRLIEAVSGGVAFLAAGVVVFARGSVRGLTTGASMWTSAALGLAAGLGYWLVAGLTAVCAVIVLFILLRIEVAAGIKDEEDDSPAAAADRREERAESG